jgi:Kef-type K+ transport system membrane component KefB
MLSVAIASKFFGVGLGGLASGLQGREAVQLGAGMVPRGEVVLIVATVGITEGLIGVDVFSTAVVMVVLTTLLVPPVLRVLFPRQEETTPPQEEFETSQEYEDVPSYGYEQTPSS